MGFRIRDDGIELIRALNRSFVPGERIDSFILRRTPRAVDYGNRTVWVKRSKRGLLPVPTLLVTPERSRWFSWMGPSGVKWQEGQVGDKIAFLNQMLVAHRSHNAPLGVAS
jgi:hypothetical protein